MKCINKVTRWHYDFIKESIDNSNFGLNNQTVYIIYDKGKETRWSYEAFHRWWIEPSQ